MQKFTTAIYIMMHKSVSIDKICLGRYRGIVNIGPSTITHFLFYHVNVSAKSRKFLAIFLFRPAKNFTETFSYVTSLLARCIDARHPLSQKGTSLACGHSGTVSRQLIFDIFHHILFGSGTEKFKKAIEAVILGNKTNKVFMPRKDILNFFSPK